MGSLAAVEPSGGLLFGLLLLGPDPGVGHIEQLGQDEQVVLAEAVGLLPFLALLVTPRGGDRVLRPLLAVILPDGEFHSAGPDLVDGLGFRLVSHGDFLYS